MHGLVLAVAALAGPAPADAGAELEVRLRSGARLTVRSAERRGGVWVVEGMDGVRYSLRERDVERVQEVARPASAPGVRSVEPRPRRPVRTGPGTGSRIHRPAGNLVVLGVSGGAPERRDRGAPSRNGAAAPDESSWRGRARVALRRLEGAARHEAELVSGLAEAERTAWSGPGGETERKRARRVARAARLQRELREALGRARAERLAAERAVAELRDAGRKAGVPPGWLR